MKKYLLLLSFVIVGFVAKSQTIDSLYFNLYTDSLKKGTHNYINVDAKFNNGRYLPLTEKQVEFSSTACKFEGNCLVIPIDFKEEKVTITVTLKENKKVSKSITLFIKKKADDEILKSTQEVLDEMKTKKPTSTKKKKNR